MPIEVRKEIEDKIKDLRDSLTGEDGTDIKNKSEGLSNSLQKIGEILYKDSQKKSGEEKGGEDTSEPKKD